MRLCDLRPADLFWYRDILWMKVAHHVEAMPDEIMPQNKGFAVDILTGIVRTFPWGTEVQKETV
jgi:hypothetical protein